MRLESVSIKNFRCYREEVTLSMSDLTTFVGKNDIGKSSVLEALEIFFNNDTIKIEQGDANIYSGDTQVAITCEFSDLPSKLSLDAGAETSLAAEYLLSAKGTLKIQKLFDCSKKAPSAEVFILANHPTASGVADLLDLKERDLQKLIQDGVPSRYGRLRTPRCGMPWRNTVSVDLLFTHVMLNCTSSGRQDAAQNESD